jgi:hypothetical protein
VSLTPKLWTDTHFRSTWYPSWTYDMLFFCNMTLCLNPWSGYKRGEQFVWEENLCCGFAIRDYRECAGALKHHLHGCGIKSAWHHALVAVSHWWVRVVSRSSHLSPLGPYKGDFWLTKQTGFHFEGKLTRDVSLGKCYHSLLYPEWGLTHWRALGALPKLRPHPQITQNAS